MKPMIAVAGRPAPPGKATSKAFVYAGRAYLEAVRRAGAQEAVVMPGTIGSDEARHLLSRFDGLLLLGGGDVDPARYGAQRHEEVAGVVAEADAFELALVRAAIDIGLPTLAVCRGMQILNVACGGTLDQHISGRDGLLSHRAPEADGGALHGVRVEPGSRLCQVVGPRLERCASHHHQAVAALGDGLTAVGRADDGLVEAVEHTDGWVIGVQWHPEETAAADPCQQALFDALVAKAGRAML